MDESKYKHIINQAIDYIQKNIEKNLTAEEIADYCCFSKFYFNRMFKANVNESVYSFIKRRKLENAAFLLRRNVNMTITEVAFRIGYSPSNFASAFKEYYGVSATEYRKNVDIPTKDSYAKVVEYISKMKRIDESFEIVNNKIEIRKIEKMNLLYERFIGNYYDLPDFWEKFCEKMEKEKLINENSIFLGISYDDPLVVDEDRCIYDCCISVENYKGTNTIIVEEGYYACYKFNDKVSNMINAFNELFSIWLPFSGYETDHRLPLEIYYPIDDSNRMRVDLCIPIENSFNY